MYSINDWFGRLGNNIQQLSNALYYCKKNNINFLSPPHNLIKKITIPFGKNINISNRFFFYSGPEKDFDVNISELNEKRRDICLEYITPNFNFHTKEPFDDSCVVIHIRSGDIFSGNPANTYVQNPLNYYLKIIENFDTAIVVTEDFNNPIIKILEKNSKVILQSTSLENDFSTLLRAKHLVSSGVGTFCVAAALCSKNITNFYCSNIFLEEHLNYTMLLKTNININLTKLNNYIKIGEWKNTLEQTKIMLEYVLDNRSK